MGPSVDSIVPDEVLPSATAVVIIGGGIIGTSATLWLAERGVAISSRVLADDTQRCGIHQSALDPAFSHVPVVQPHSRRVRA